MKTNPKNPMPKINRFAINAISTENETPIDKIVSVKTALGDPSPWPGNALVRARNRNTKRAPTAAQKGYDAATKASASIPGEKLLACLKPERFLLTHRNKTISPTTTKKEATSRPNIAPEKMRFKMAISPRDQRFSPGRH